GPDLTPVPAVDVVGERVEAVDAARREVRERAEDALPLAVPERHAEVDVVAEVRVVVVQAVARAGGVEVVERAAEVGRGVELVVAEEVLGAPRSALQERLVRLGEAQKVAA